MTAERYSLHCGWQAGVKVETSDELPTAYISDQTGLVEIGDYRASQGDVATWCAALLEAIDDDRKADAT